MRLLRPLTLEDASRSAFAAVRPSLAQILLKQTAWVLGRKRLSASGIELKSHYELVRVNRPNER